MKHVVSIIVGICVAAMAGAAGLESFSPAWWVFLIAGNIAVSAPRALVD